MRAAKELGRAEPRRPYYRRPVLRIHQNRLDAEGRWRDEPGGGDANLCLVLCDRKMLGPHILAETRRAFPHALVVGATTAGQIAGGHMVDDAAVVTAVGFDQARVRVARARTDAGSYSAAGAELARQLGAPDLRMVFVLTEGIRMNGSELARGLVENLDSSVVIGGGLAADGNPVRAHRGLRR